jgi:hypothetical protein
MLVRELFCDVSRVERGVCGEDLFDDLLHALAFAAHVEGFAGGRRFGRCKKWLARRQAGLVSLNRGHSTAEASSAITIRGVGGVLQDLFDDTGAGWKEEAFSSTQAVKPRRALFSTTWGSAGLLLFFVCSGGRHLWY